MFKTPRSRTVIIISASEIPEIAHWPWNEILPPEDNEFYESFDYQLKYLKQMTLISIQNLCKLMKISTSTYYLFNSIKPIQIQRIQELPGRPKIVSDEDEIQLLRHIEFCQSTFNCIRPREARQWLERYILETKGQNITLDRCWFYRFRQRHSDQLKVIKVHSRESQRCDVNAADINLYFNQLIEALNKISNYSLVVNMDESGFYSRPLKNTSQNCCFISGCTIPPAFREVQDASHISIVAAVTMDGRTLKPMLLSVNQKPPSNIKNTWLENTFEWHQTPKGYMNHDSMFSWIKNILIPYVNERRAQLNDQNLHALLLFDGLKAHLMEDIKDELDSNGILTVQLPPHSSHLLQVLDVSIFSPMKTYYRNSKTQLFSEDARKMAKKVEKIIKAFHFASYNGNIFSGWEECGIQLHFNNGNVSKATINRAKVLAKLGK